MDGPAPPLRFEEGSDGSLGYFLETVPEGSVVSLAPGTIAGPIVVRRSVHLRGSGELTRLVGVPGRSVLDVQAAPGVEVSLSAVLIQRADAEQGAGIRVRGGRVRLQQIDVRDARSLAGGGAVSVTGGEVTMERFRVSGVSASRGGAFHVAESGVLALVDGQVDQARANFGGFAAVLGQARLSVSQVTIRRPQAYSAAGGQVLFLEGAPSVEFERVRVEGTPLGGPIAAAAGVPSLRMQDSDVPRSFQDYSGLLDGGGNAFH